MVPDPVDSRAGLRLWPILGKLGIRLPKVRSMAANAFPELSVSVGKARLGGRLSWRRHVRKTG